MSPAPKEAVTKVAAVIAGPAASAKDIKKESTPARILGAGMYLLKVFMRSQC
jgi:hypothetical protein